MFPYKRVHVIGIGGIGVSAIAKLLHAHGVMVTGSDMADSSIVQDVITAGITVSVGESDGAIAAAADAVVYSEAVPAENPERAAARAAGRKEMSGGAFLGELTGKYKTICIAGTHGKSTTTAMIGAILEAAELDPTVMVGSKVPGWPLGNLRVGKGEWLVLEADEYARKFLQYDPHIALITNLEHDHPDVYPTEQDMVAAFQEFVGRVQSDGIVIVNADVPRAAGLTVAGERRTFGSAPGADVVAADRTTGDGGQRFRVTARGATLGQVALRVPGRINMTNALAAIAVCDAIGVSFAVMQQALAAFPGIWRRFEYVGRVSETFFPGPEADRPLVISDYGHHPTAVEETVAAARETYPDRRIVLAFQPHQRQRTDVLKDAFVAALQTPDQVLLADIYAVAGRDTETAVTSQTLVDAVNQKKPGIAMSTGDRESTARIIKKEMQRRDVLLVMGAGDIDQVARSLVAG